MLLNIIIVTGHKPGTDPLYWAPIYSQLFISDFGSIIEDIAICLLTYLQFEFSEWTQFRGRPRGYSGVTYSYFDAKYHYSREDSTYGVTNNFSGLPDLYSSNLSVTSRKLTRQIIVLEYQY